MSYVIEGSIFEYEPERLLEVPGSNLARFTEHMTRADENIDLIEAVLLIAGSEYPGLNIGYYLQKLEIMAKDVRLLLAGEADPYNCVKVLNSYLYNTLGFHGNQENYDDPRNSYLNDVLELRTGIPITLSLVYIEVGRQVGLPLEGVGLPGHFIVRYRKHASQTIGRWEHAQGQVPDEDREILLDPFNAGAILSKEDCASLVRQVYGDSVPMLQSFLKPVTNKEFLFRVLNNLKTGYITLQDYDRALRIEQYLIAVQPDEIAEIRDRGALNFQAGKKWSAIIDFQKYLKHQPNASDAVFIREQVSNIFKQIAKLN